jgi:hypothetical protein
MRIWIVIPLILLPTDASSMFFAGLQANRAGSNYRSASVPVSKPGSEKLIGSALFNSKKEYPQEDNRRPLQLGKI